MATKPAGHTVDYCTTVNKRIKYAQQFPGRMCPHCDINLPKKGEVVDPNAPPPKGIQLSTTDSIVGYRIVESQGVVFVQQANRYQGMGTSRMDNTQAKKTTGNLLRTMVPGEVRRLGGNAAVGIRFDIHDTFTIVYGTSVTVEPE
jgi:uncharacterized protein YbjQ (UPF0145 family)